MPATFPDIHLTGAVHHWVQAHWMTEPYYLGTAEISPQVQMRQYYSESHAASAGSILAYQRIYEGQAATVTVIFTRWSKFAEFGVMVNGKNTIFTTDVAVPAPQDSSPPVFTGSIGGIHGGGTLVQQGPWAGLPVDVGNPSTPGLPGFGAADLESYLSGAGIFNYNPNPSAPPSGDAGDDDVEGPIGGGTSYESPGSNPGAPAGSAPGPTQGPVPFPTKTVKQGAAIGSETRWSRGSAAFGNRDFKLWQVFDFAGWPRSQSAGLEFGRYWPQVTIDRHSILAAGTQGKKVLFVFDCQPKFIPSASPFGAPGPTGNERGHMLFSIETANFPSSVFVPQ